MEALMADLRRLQISNFFENSAPTTQQQCDQEAERITGGAVCPTPVQGGASYTVLANDGALVVQFRLGRSPLDLDFLGYIKKTYGNFVPRPELTGRLGELYVYSMDNVGGVSMYLAREKLHQDNCRLLHRTVKDFALFFASAWHNTPNEMPCPTRDSLFSEYSSRLSQLAEGLPERFHPSLKYLIANLPRLFAKDWPMVPNHDDLLENNIHVDQETGQILGICDWKDTLISPFGMSLGGLESALGIRTKRGWRYHANQQELRDIFWEAFYDAIGQVSEEQKKLFEVARLVGIFLENGFDWDSDGNTFPAGEGHETLDYLDAVALGLLSPAEQ